MKTGITTIAGILGLGLLKRLGSRAISNKMYEERLYHIRIISTIEYLDSSEDEVSAALNMADPELQKLIGKKVLIRGRKLEISSIYTTCHEDAPMDGDGYLDGAPIIASVVVDIVLPEDDFLDFGVNALDFIRPNDSINIDADNLDLNLGNLLVVNVLDVDFESIESLKIQVLESLKKGGAFSGPDLSDYYEWPMIHAQIHQSKHIMVQTEKGPIRLLDQPDRKIRRTLRTT